MKDNEGSEVSKPLPMDEMGIDHIGGFQFNIDIQRLRAFISAKDQTIADLRAEVERLKRLTTPSGILQGNTLHELATLRQRNAKLVEALKTLSFAAQITGGVAGRDENLVSAIDKASILLNPETK